MKVKPLAALMCVLCAAPASAQSYYTVRLDDPKAVHADAMGARGDGAADDTAAIQAAIDRVQESTGHGIVFLPEGRYRITRTLHVWPSIRLIGYGARRPALILAADTPGFTDPAAENQLVFFAGSRPGATAGGRGTAAGARPPDANPGTFYSAMCNIDIEIGPGNAGAVGVRGTYAQHSFLAHMEFRIGPGIAGVHDTGNVMEDVRFIGGTYGIWTRTPSPSWQFMAVDAYFEGQREAAIRERAAGLTLVRPHVRRVPTAIAIDEGFHDELWVKDGRFEEVTGPAVIISLEDNPRTQINMENVVCRGVPEFALFRESGKRIAGPAEMYEVRAFSHGLRYADIGAQPVTDTRIDAVPIAALPAPAASDLVPLPPAATWVNIRTLGAKGDGSADDTAAFRSAIAAHRAIYVPSGAYLISDTLELRPDTVLIGLHPLATQLVLPDRTRAFQGVGPPKPMIEAPKGGTNVVIGIGLYTNGINPRAVAAKWMAGAASMMNDVRFLGGHGTVNLDGTRTNPYNNNRTADPDANRRWDSQYPSLWVTDGGGGTFFDIWTPSSFASAGMLISDTSTEGRVYAMSSEHHVRYEVQVRNAANWRLYALQTEAERGESGFALPLEIDGSRDITIANLHIYRVISSYQPFPHAVKVSNSRDIRFRNVHCYSNSKVSFDAAVFDATHGAEIRQREFAWLTLSGAAPVPAPKPPSPVLEAGAQVRKLVGGFFNISGGAADPAGDFYAIDARWQRIHRWSDRDGRISTVHDAPLEPVNLAFDRAGNLLVVSYAGAGSVYAFTARFSSRQPEGARTDRGRSQARPDRRARGRRLAPGPGPGDRPAAGKALPLPVARRHYVHPGRQRLHDRRHVVGRQERRPGPRIRPRRRRARTAVLRDERVGSDDVERHARRRRGLHGTHAVRPAGRRGRRGGCGRQRLPGRRAHLRLQPGGPPDRHDRGAGASGSGRLRRRGRPDAVHRGPHVALQRADAAAGAMTRGRFLFASKTKLG